VRPSVLILVVAAALAAPAAAAAFGWPVKPFDRQHPIRSAFGDPRYHTDAESAISSFHFGIDIVAPDGTRVYAVEPGIAHAHPDHVKVVRGHGRAYEYWHIRPVVRSGERIRMHQFLGRIIKGWGHVHLAESFRGAYRNPLRRGALTPFHDRTVPTVDLVEMLGSDGLPVNPSHVTGFVDVVASAYDTSPIAPPAPWQNAHLAPATIWCVLSGPGIQTETSLVVDFGLRLPPNLLYPLVYAPGTYQNKANRPGRYLFWVLHTFDTSTLPDGSYQLEVEASDTRGNVGTRTFAFRTVNGRTTGAPDPHEPGVADPARPE
jgi:hypothetical protein